MALIMCLDLRQSKHNPRQLVPCGKCFECLMDKSNDWITRLLIEQMTTPPTYWITLTYDDEHIPLDAKNTFIHDFYGDVWPLFRELKRDGYKIRYYLIAERGTLGERPHYHFFSFGIDILTLYRYLDKYWNKGIFTIDPMTFGDITYTALFHVSIKQGEFVRMSRNPGIGGKPLPNQLYEQCFARPGNITLDGRVRKMPNYVIKKSFDDAYDAEAKSIRYNYAMEKYQQIRSSIGLDYESPYEGPEVIAKIRAAMKKIEDAKRLRHSKLNKKYEYFP